MPCYGTHLMITFEEALCHGTALFAGGPNDDDGQLRSHDRVPLWVVR